MDANGDCKVCDDGDMMENGSCAAVSSCGIDHCVECTGYNGKAECIKCKNNFVVMTYESSEDEEIKTKCIHENGRIIGC